MNNGMFAPTLGTVEERILHIEQTLPNLARLQEQSICFEKLDKLALDLDAVLKKEKSIQSVIDGLVNDYNDNMKRFSNQHRVASDFIAEIQVVTSASQGKIDQLQAHIKKEADSHLASKVALENRLDSLKSHFAGLSAVNELKEVIAVMTVQHNAMKAEMSELRKEGDKNASKHAGILLDIEQLKKQSFDLAKSLEDLKIKFESEKLQTKKMLKDLAIEITGLIEQQKKEFEAKLAALPKPQNIDVEALKLDIMQRIEPSSFEAKNANLRSSNNESKIVLLEKKVEQLFLLLNKYELSK